MTPKQNELYQWLLARADNPVCPTYDEMAEAMQLKSKSNISRLVAALIQHGKVTKVEGRERTVRAVSANPFLGIPSAALIAELKARGEWNGR